VGGYRNHQENFLYHRWDEICEIMGPRTMSRSRSRPAAARFDRRANDDASFGASQDPGRNQRSGRGNQDVQVMCEAPGKPMHLIEENMTKQLECAT